MSCTTTVLLTVAPVERVQQAWAKQSVLAAEAIGDHVEAIDARLARAPKL